MSDKLKLEQKNIEVIKKLFDAHNEKNIDKIRNLLSNDFNYKSPSANINNADDFVSSLSEMLGALDKTEITKILADGNNIAVLQKTSMLVPINGKTNMNAVEWYEMENAKVKSLTFFHDLVGILEFENKANSKKKLSAA